jgi:predicted CoA-binding protein
MFHDSATIRRILEYAQTIAMVGLSSNPTRPSHQVAEYLLRAGFAVIPVNPREIKVLGIPAVATLDDVPVPIDVVNVFREPSAVPEIAQAAVRVKARSLWLQIGVIAPESAVVARQAGLDVVMDRCILVEHRKHDTIGAHVDREQV